MVRKPPRDMPSQSMLTPYLAWMRQENPDGSANLEADIGELFATPTGLRVLKMMEKSVLFAGVPNGAPESALREVNAVRNFVLELRRLADHG